MVLQCGENMLKLDFSRHSTLWKPVTWNSLPGISWTTDGQRAFGVMAPWNLIICPKWMNRTSRIFIGMETHHVWGNQLATHAPSDFHKPDVQVPNTIKGFVSNGFKSGGTYKRSWFMECHHQPSQIWGCPPWTIWTMYPMHHVLSIP